MSPIRNPELLPFTINGNSSGFTGDATGPFLSELSGLCLVNNGFKLFFYKSSFLNKAKTEQMRYVDRTSALRTHLGRSTYRILVRSRGQMGTKRVPNGSQTGTKYYARSSYRFRTDFVLEALFSSKTVFFDGGNDVFRAKQKQYKWHCKIAHFEPKKKDP